MAQVILLEDGHRYRREAGYIVPASVTDIAGIYGEDVDEAYEDAIDRAADRGVTMHSVLGMALTGQDYSGEYPGIYQPYVDSIEAFLSEHAIVPILIEQPIYSETLDIAGTPDCIAFVDDTLTLLDWKFVSSICKPKVRAQLTGYNEILREAGVFVEQMAAVQFLPDKPRLYPVDFGGDEWAAALKIWEIKNRKYARGRIG